MDSNRTIHLKGLDYSLSLFHDTIEPNKFYRFDTNPNRKALTQILPFINTQKIVIETFLERLFWDLAEFIDDTNFIEDFCATIEKQIDIYPKKTKITQSPKKLAPPQKDVFILGKNETRSYNYQFYATYFDKGNFFDPTSSINLREHLRGYKREVYGLLKCKNYYFHNFYWNIYFSDLNYLEFLKLKLNGYSTEFIRLLFCKDKLVVILKRDINDNIECFGTVLEVLDKFLLFGLSKFYSILYDFEIDTTNFRELIGLETYTQYHLAKCIGCNIESEQPELLKRLKMNQMNDMESLANIGLKYHSHYIDYSHFDKYGYKIAEYETQYDYQDGMSRAELERDLLILEPEFRPREQTTIDNFLVDNKKAYMLIKGYLPISEFSIEPNRGISRLLPLERNSFNGLHDLDKKAIPFYMKPILKLSTNH